MPTTPPEAGPEPQKTSSGLIALRNAVIVVVVLLLLRPLPTIALPLAAIAAMVGLWYVVRSSFRVSRMLGTAVSAAIVLVVAGVTGLVVKAEVEHVQLLEKLAQYKHTSVRREFTLLPQVVQLSVSGSVDDEELQTMIEMPEMEHLQDLYLESDNLTDACLQAAAGIEELRYLFVNGRGITDEAILAFEQEHPDCQVIAYGRDLHAGEGGIQVIDMRPAP